MYHFGSGSAPQRVSGTGSSPTPLPRTASSKITLPIRIPAATDCHPPLNVAPSSLRRADQSLRYLRFHGFRASTERSAIRALPHASLAPRRRVGSPGSGLPPVPINSLDQSPLTAEWAWRFENHPFYPTYPTTTSRLRDARRSRGNCIMRLPPVDARLSSRAAASWRRSRPASAKRDRSRRRTIINTGIGWRRSAHCDDRRGGSGAPCLARVFGAAAGKARSPAQSRTDLRQHARDRRRRACRPSAPTWCRMALPSPIPNLSTKRLPTRRRSPTLIACTRPASTTFSTAS